ncbi:MAG TPA: hypothetical protein VGA17_06295 [Nitrospiraceae bacterium]
MQRYVAAGLMLFTMAGCAVKTPHKPLAQWPVDHRGVFYANPAPLRIAIAPFTDQRPREEIKGLKPTGMFFLLWNRRKGEYYTGDHIFGADIPTGIAHWLTRYLDEANIAAHVVQAPTPATPIDFSNAEQVRRYAAAHVADFVLTGDIEHFHGSQYQNTSFYLLPLWFINTFGWQDELGLPWGRTAIRFSLYDGRSGDAVWKRTLDASETMPAKSSTMAEAALESLSTVGGNLAIAIRQLNLQPPVMATAIEEAP